MTSGGQKFLEGFDCAHTVRLNHKMLTNSIDRRDLSIGFDEGNEGRKNERTRIEEAPNKGRFHFKVSLGEVFGSTEHLQKYLRFRMKSNNN